MLITDTQAKAIRKLKRQLSLPNVASEKKWVTQNYLRLRWGHQNRSDGLYESYGIWTGKRLLNIKNTIFIYQAFQ